VAQLSGTKDGGTKGPGPSAPRTRGAGDRWW
jgi:hypothetical protein